MVSKRSQHSYVFLFLIILLAFLLIYYFLLPLVVPATYEADGQVVTASSTTRLALHPPTPAPIVVTHLATPKPLKAIYMTACVASRPSLRNALVDFIRQSEINAVLINVKDETGKISIATDNPLFAAAYKTSGCPVVDMKAFVAELHQHQIYAIARIAVFQDPHLVALHPEWAVRRASDGAVWKDRKGISWLEVKAVPVWDYTAELSREAYKLGFDEINLDYIRFPSDGDMKNISYRFYNAATETKSSAVRSFFAGMHERLKNLGAPVSVDLFGMTSTNYDDLGIGQVLEDALPYFDYIAPMIYPSHYPPGWNGYAKPATVPYEVIKYNMDKAVARAIAASSSPEKIRPWLQDFNLGATYTADMVRAQIRATNDAGLDSWMIWDPKNLYTRAAYLPAR